MSEQQRLEMHLGLRKCLGDSVADSVMEHLPQGGWSDVARTRDIDHLSQRIEVQTQRLDGQSQRIDVNSQRIDLLSQRIDVLDGRIKLLIGGTLTVGVALFALQVQVLLELAKL